MEATSRGSSSSWTQGGRKACSSGAQRPPPGGPDGDRSVGPGAAREYYIMITNHSADWNLIMSLLSW